MNPWVNGRTVMAVCMSSVVAPFLAAAQEAKPVPPPAKLKILNLRFDENDDD